MYKIMLQKHSYDGMDKFDEIIEINTEDAPIFTYSKYMNEPYFFGRLVKIVNGKEERIASFCNSDYAKPELR